MNFAEFIQRAENDYRIHSRSMRRGQCYFNLFAEVNKTAADRISGHADIDPYYEDTKIGRFVQWLLNTNALDKDC